MSISEFVTAGATVVLVFVTAWYAWTTKEILQQNRNAASSQMLHNLLSDYNSPELQLAVSALWAFRRAYDNDDAFLTGYWDRYRTDFQRLRGRLDDYPGTEVVRDSIDFQRRLVSGFYRRLDALIAKGILSKEEADAFWSQKDRLILDKIIRPAESTMALAHWSE